MGDDHRALFLMLVGGVMVWNWFRAKNDREGTQDAQDSLGAQRTDLGVDLANRRGNKLIRPEEQGGFFSKTFHFLGKVLTRPLRRLMGEETLSREDLDRLEELLYEADFGPQLVEQMLQEVEMARIAPGQDPLAPRLQALQVLLERSCEEAFDAKSCRLFEQIEEGKRLKEGSEGGCGPLVLFVLGINGSGKTTTIAKLAHRLHHKGRRVLLVAADTFRAAAKEQLLHWAEDIGCQAYTSPTTKDPAALCYEAMGVALEEAIDVVLVDTAGRWHSKEPLMKELEKMRRACEKRLNRPCDGTLMVLDGVTGQNALLQSDGFDRALGIDGVIVTKLDGGAKGGAAISMMHRQNQPIFYIGMGESADDLKPFILKEFIEALLGSSR